MMKLGMRAGLGTACYLTWVLVDSLTCGELLLKIPEVFVGLQEVGQGNLVDDWPPRAVDQHSLLLHHVQPVLVHQVVRVLIQVAV